MKGCGFAAVRDLLLYVVIAGAFAWLLAGDDEKLLELIAPAAFCAAPFWIALRLIAGVAQVLRERSMLRRTDEPPRDGDVCALAGIIRATSLLRAPLSGVECIAFSSAVHTWIRVGSRQSQVTLYEALAVTPAVVDTRAGSFRLLAVPTFDFDSELLDAKTASRSAQSLFTRPEIKKARPPRGRLAEQWSDDDGSYRYEADYTTSPIDLNNCTFTESLVRPGEQIILIGRYSAAHGGIVADENWANVTRIMKGDATAAIASLTRRAKRYVIAALLFCAAGVAMFMLIRDAV